MTRQSDLKVEEKQAKLDQQLVRAVEFELQGSISHSGGILNGITIMIYPEDVLIVLKAEVAGRQQVSFVAAETMATGIRKSVRDAYSDRLRWRVDKYANDDN